MLGKVKWFNDAKVLALLAVTMEEPTKTAAPGKRGPRHRGAAAGIWISR
jgi:hypothetical protein